MTKKQIAKLEGLFTTYVTKTLDKVFKLNFIDFMATSLDTKKLFTYLQGPNYIIMDWGCWNSRKYWEGSIGWIEIILIPGPKNKIFECFYEKSRYLNRRQ